MNSSDIHRRYYDLGTHILATTPRCGSRSVVEVHKDLPLKRREWVKQQKEARGILVYGIMRKPLHRVISAWKKLAPKRGWELSFHEMFTELADNSHVIQNVDLHPDVDVWLKFEDCMKVMPVHVNKSDPKLPPPIPVVEFMEFYRDDWRIWNGLETRPAAAYRAALGVGTGNGYPGSDLAEGLDPGEWFTQQRDGLVQPGKVPGAPGEAEGASPEGTGGGDG